MTVIGIPREIHPGEKRVAATPQTILKLKKMGFDVAVDYPGATFYGSGGYHHQLAGNVWNKRDAVVRPSGMAGVDEVEIIAHKANIVANVVARASNMAVVHRTQGSEVTLLDPWGIAIRIRA